METKHKNGNLAARLAGVWGKPAARAAKEPPGSLREFGTRFTRREDAERVLEQSLRAAIRQTGATAAYVMLLDPDGARLHTEVAVSMGEERALPTEAGLDNEVEGVVIRTERSVLIARASAEAEAVVCVPLMETESVPDSPGRQCVIGTLTLLQNGRGQTFTEDDKARAGALADVAAVAVVNSRLYEGQRANFMHSLQALARTLDDRNPYTQGHSERVAQVCVRLAQKLGVAPEIVQDLYDGALLHDIGKIGIPEAVLDKPGQLTEEEFALIKQIPLRGSDICAPLGLSDGILMLIRNAHEKLDGTGYPDGLKYGQLPLPLRLLCVADAFDAMSTRRPYRPVIDSRFRREQLNRFAGTQFDPTIVETLKGLLNAGALDEIYADHWATEDGLSDAPTTFGDAAPSPRLTLLRAA